MRLSMMPSRADQEKHGNVLVDSADAATHLKTIYFRHHDIEHHHIGPFPLEQRQRPFAALRHAAGIAGLLANRLNESAHAGIVVSHHHFERHRSSITSQGIRTANVLPHPTSLSTEAVPPKSSATSFTKASPSPLPP